MLLSLVSEGVVVPLLDPVAAAAAVMLCDAVRSSSALAAVTVVVSAVEVDFADVGAMACRRGAWLAQGALESLADSLFNISSTCRWGGMRQRDKRTCERCIERITPAVRACLQSRYWLHHSSAPDRNTQSNAE